MKTLQDELTHYKAALTESTVTDLAGNASFVVKIPANVWDGKYFDYRSVRYKVPVGKDGVNTAEDALAWVKSHADQVVQELTAKEKNTRARYPQSGGSRKNIMTPVHKNVWVDKAFVPN